MTRDPGLESHDNPRRPYMLTHLLAGAVDTTPAHSRGPLDLWISLALILGSAAYFGAMALRRRHRDPWETLAERDRRRAGLHPELEEDWLDGYARRSGVTGEDR